MKVTWGDATPFPETAAGVALLWLPAPLLFLQILWLAIFVPPGRAPSPARPFPFTPF